MFLKLLALFKINVAVANTKNNKPKQEERMGNGSIPLNHLIQLSLLFQNGLQADPIAI